MTTLATPERICVVSPQTVQPRVLIVEDDGDVRKALEVQLRVNDLDVASAADGNKAIEYLQRHSPDVMILDLGLPGVDGFDILDRMSQITKEPPEVIVLSAWDESRCEPLAVSRGAAMFLEKPIAFDELLVGIKFLLDNRNRPSRGASE